MQSTEPKFAKVFLASKQPVKIAAAKTFFKEVVPCETKSMVSEQPFGSEEIQQGARNRLNCINAIPAVSFETGIEKRGDDYFDVTYCVLRTPLGYFYGSNKFPIQLPDHVEQLKKWLELPNRQEITLGSLIAARISCSPNDWYYLESRSNVMAEALRKALFDFQNWRNALCTNHLPANLKKHRGVDFIDIQSCLATPNEMLKVTDQLTHGLLFNAVVCIEARGFLFAGAFEAKKFPVIMARKPGKLPGEELQVEYDKEYGKDAICIQKGLINKGDKVIIVDDVIATGGTMLAVAKLVEMCGAEVVGFVAPFMVVKPGGELMCPPAVGQNCRFLQTQESLTYAAQSSALNSTSLLPSDSSPSTLNQIDNLMRTVCTNAIHGMHLMPDDTYCIFPKGFEYYGKTEGINWGSFYQSSNIWFQSDAIKGKNVLVFVDLTNSSSTLDVLQLLTIIKKKDPKTVRVVFTFIEQGTQDRIEYKRITINGLNSVIESIAQIDTIARLFRNHKAITFDLHALQSQLVFEDLSCYSLMTHLWKKYKDQHPDAIPVFPDEGAKKRFSGLLEIKNAVCFVKDRGASGLERNLKLDVPLDPKTTTGRFVIIDDLVRSGGTMSEAAKYLRSIGATKVDVMFSHAPFQSDTARKFVGFDSVWTSDSCPQHLPREWVKVKVMDVLAEIKF